MKRLLVLALPIAILTSLSALASADVGPRCKCSMPGAANDGAIGGVMLGGAGLILLAVRSRRRR